MKLLLDRVRGTGVAVAVHRHRVARVVRNGLLQLNLVLPSVEGELDDVRAEVDADVGAGAHGQTQKHLGGLVSSPALAL